MSAKNDLLWETIKLFEEHGRKAIDLCDFARYEFGNSEPNGLEGFGLELDTRVYPFFSAALLGFSMPLLTRIVKESGLTPDEFWGYFSPNGSKPFYYNSHELKTIDFVKKLCEACFLTYGDVEEAKRDFSEAIRGNSIISLGVMSLALEGVSPVSEIESEMLRLANSERHIRLIDDLTIVTVTDVLENLEYPSDLPNGNARDFLEQSGAIHPAVLRKHLSKGFWETVICKSSENNVACQELLKAFITSYPEKARFVLSSLDFSDTEFLSDSYSAEGVFAKIKSCFEKAGVLDFSSDANFKTSHIGFYLQGDTNGLTFNSSREDFNEFFDEYFPVGELHALRELRGDLYGAIMASQLKMPVESISISNYRVLGFLRELKPIAQVVDRELLSRYLAHMAKAAVYVVPKGIEFLNQQKAYLTETIREGMAMLTQERHQDIDYALLACLDEDAKAFLSDWGLSLDRLQIKREKTRADRLSNDLGL